MKQDTHREYTIPDVQKGIKEKNRERVVVALGELEFRKILQSRKKGRVSYYTWFPKIDFSRLDEV